MANDERKPNYRIPNHPITTGGGFIRALVFGILSEFVIRVSSLHWVCWHRRPWFRIGERLPTQCGEAATKRTAPVLGRSSVGSSPGIVTTLSPRAFGVRCGRGQPHS